ncbi:MAG: leucine-rich repeat domain-containing protein [Anaerolineae bacterium]|nr:leucine-rich repeat domain-containing protein [Anaerolineae bacterium]
MKFFVNRPTLPRLVRPLLFAALVLALLFSLAGAATTHAAPNQAFTDCATQVSISELECNALLALYTSTNGAAWTNNTNWLTADNPCSWYGVNCTAGFVVTLTLSNNNLTGTLPIEIGNLTHLVYLYVQTNQITGSIPTQIGNMTSLSILYAFGNQFSGTIPVELGSLANLTRIGLNHNQLTGSIPTQLGNLSLLETLTLNNNQLTGGIPIELGNLSNLTLLWLGSNPLGGTIPAQLGNLSNLESLNLVSNQLTGSIPAQLGNLSNLTILSFNNNLLTGSIPAELGNLASIAGLNLGINQLSGSIPSALGNLTTLSLDLNLSGNDFSGSIPPSLGNLVNLQYIYLNSNQLTGSIPPEFGGLTSLKVLYIYNNQLSGSLPAELGYLPSLDNIYVANNPNLSGPVPQSFVNLSLTYFYYSTTNICEPTDPTFLSWYASILNKINSGITCTELLQNVSFEEDVPHGWIGKLLTPDQDKTDCTQALLGSCSYKMVGDGDNSVLISYFPGIRSAGDSVSLKVFNRTNAAGGSGSALLRLVFIYTDESKDIITAPFNQGTHGWQQVILNATAAKDYRMITVSLIYTLTAGEIWWDDVILNINGGSNLFAAKNASFEMSVPNGWVGKLIAPAVDTTDCTVARTASCSYNMTGDGDNSVLITYKPRSGLAGETLTLSVWNMTNGAGGTGSALLRLVIIYNDETKDIITTPFNQGTHGWEVASITATAAKDYRMITVSLIFTLTTGDIWWDDISLVLTVP